MAKGKKKKKDVDFQKIKLKIGRKLKRDSNETKAEFKSRKIVIKEVRKYANDPIASLSRHSDRISLQSKIKMLNHFNQVLNPDIVKNLNKPTLDGLSKFIMDHSDQVRAVTIKCLKTCYNQLKQQHLSTKDFMYSLKPYLDCAYTHLSVDIKSDCHKLLEYFVNMNDPNTMEPLMSVILRKYQIGSLTSSENKLAVQLRRYYFRHCQKLRFEDKLVVDQCPRLIWNESDYFIDFDKIIYNLDGDRWQEESEVLLIPREKIEKIGEMYLNVIEDDGSQVESSVNLATLNDQAPAKRRFV